MKEPEETTKEELREELRGSLISPSVDELSLDELEAIKESVDIENLKSELVWEGITSKSELLNRVKKSAEHYKQTFDAMKRDGKQWAGTAQFAMALY